MIRDKIILNRLNMYQIEELLKKESLTKEESIFLYGKKEVEEMERRYKEDTTNQLSKEEHDAYIQEVFKEEIATAKQIKELKENKNNEILEIVKTLQQTQTKLDNTSDILENLEQYFNDYLEYRTNHDKVSSSSIKAYKASFRYLKYFINDDIVLNFKFFKQVQKQFTQLPKNFFKYEKYYKKPFEKVIKLKYETLDNKTINNHISNFKTFFDYLLYEEIIENNPLNNIKPLVEAIATNKEEYTPEELTKIFNSNMDINYLNMCKVALYSGFRIEEVLSIKKQDIEDNLIHITLQDKSTKKHTRIIPIHKNLLDTINYQKKHNKGVYLFFNGNVDNEVKNVGKRLNRRLKEVINIKEKTFHSFRKNFSQELELNTTGEEKIKKYLMGHSLAKDITHLIYNRNKVNITKLEDCINQITFNF